MRIKLPLYSQLKHLCFLLFFIITNYLFVTEVVVELWKRIEFFNKKKFGKVFLNNNFFQDTRTLYFSYFSCNLGSCRWRRILFSSKLVKGEIDWLPKSLSETCQISWKKKKYISLSPKISAKKCALHLTENALFRTALAHT